jgi:hypothetical protein
VIRGARTVGAFFFADHQQQVDSVLAGISEAIRGGEHRRGDSLRVTRTATVQAIAVHAWWHVRWDRIEMRRQRDATAAARCPDVAAARRHFLHGHVPAATHQTPRYEFDDLPLAAGGRLD